MNNESKQFLTSTCKRALTTNMRKLNTICENGESNFGVSLSLPPQGGLNASKAIQYWFEQVTRQEKDVSDLLADLESHRLAWEEHLRIKGDNAEGITLTTEMEQYFASQQTDGKNFEDVLERGRKFLALLLARNKELTEAMAKIDDTTRCVSPTPSPVVQPHASSHWPSATTSQMANAPTYNATPLVTSLGQYSRPFIQKLPPLNLPKFSGDPDEWLPFYELFEENVDLRTDLDLATKMGYLQEYVTGDAKALIAHLPKTKYAYTEAFQTLKYRYSEPSVQLGLQYAKLQSMPVTPEASRECEITLATIRGIFAQLKRLGDNCDGGYLVELALSRFPNTICFQVKKHLREETGTTGPWKMDVVMKQLQEQIAILRLKEKPNSLSTITPIATVSAIKKENNCLFCGEYHRAYECHNYTIEQKMDLLKRERRCFKCFGSHSISTCGARIPDCACGFGHSPSLCYRQQRTRARNSPQRFDSRNRSHSRNRDSSYRNYGQKEVLSRHSHIDTPHSPRRSDWKNRDFYPTPRSPRRSERWHDDSRPPDLHTRPSDYCTLSPYRQRSEHRSRVDGYYRSSSRDRRQDFSRREESKSPQRGQRTASAPNTHNSRERTDDLRRQNRSPTPRPTVRINAAESQVPEVALMCVRAQVLDREGERHCANIFIDEGSNVSLIERSFADQLGLKKNYTGSFNIKTLGTSPLLEADGSEVELQVLGHDGHVTPLKLQCFSSLPTLRSAHLPSIDREMIKNNDYRLAEHDLSGHVAVDILIGNDAKYDFCFPKGQSVIRLPSGLRLVPTIFGHVISGKQDGHSKKQKERAAYFSLREQQKNYWDLELLGIKDKMVPDETEPVSLEEYLKHGVQVKNGIPYLKFLFKNDHPPLPDNYGIALRRLESVQRQLAAKPDLWKAYSDTIAKQKDRGIVEVADHRVSESVPVHYLAHQPVINLQKSTTPLRVVYDASAHLKGQPSLNDCMHSGPDLLPSLTGMLLRFRTAKYIAIGDIEKAFLQVRLQEDQKDCVRFLWLKDASKPLSRDNIEILRFTRVPFGLTCAPFMLTAAIIHQFRAKQVHSLHGLESNLYVDNTALGSENETILIEDCLKAKQLFSDLKMNLREFRSNSDFVNTELDQLGLGISNNPQQKFLGISWNTANDELSFKALPVLTGPLTRRRIVSHVSSMFDPLGLLSPLMLRSKVFMQHLSKAGYQWDAVLSKEDEEQWKKIETDARLEFISIPRHFSLSVLKTPATLCVFTDASSIAFATVAYLRVFDQRKNCHRTSLLMSKCRLTPSTGPTTIPRLELMGLVIGLNLTTFLFDELNETLNITKIQLFSDSTIALSWIFKEQPPDIFVRNRVNSMRTKVSMLQVPLAIHYVATENNSADLPTRGITAKDMNKREWWNGPAFLSLPENKWPQETIQPFRDMSLFLEEEQSPEKLAVVATTGRTNSLGLFKDDQLKSFVTMKFMAAYVGRIIRTFVYNRLRAKQQPHTNLLADRLCDCFPLVESFRPLEWSHASLPLNGQEVNAGLLILIKDHQQQFLSNAMDTHKNLFIFKDAYGIIRCRGRLGKSHLPHDAKHPLLVHRKSFLTQMLMRDAHEQCAHEGANSTLAQFRNKYWCAKGFAIAKKVVLNCTLCRRYNERPFRYPPMADLPERRVTRSSPFTHCGLDYLGPLKFKKENGSEGKCWILLLTCLATRLIHLEIVLSLDIKSFMLSLRRFFARFRVPETLTSDNAPTFQQANSVLKELHTRDNQEWNRFLASHGISWKFITPHSPWMGGVYERLIGSVKKAFYKATGIKQLPFDELQTLITEIAACVNSRPLLYVNEYSTDVLRPINFLFPELTVYTFIDHEPASTDRVVAFAPTDVSREQAIAMWRSASAHLDRFWDIWHREYIAGLRERHQLSMTHQKGKKTRVPIVGEIVLLLENSPRAYWPMGRITKIIPSEDEQVRSVELQLGNRRIVRRPVNLLIPLEIFTSMSESDHNTQTLPPEAPLRRSLRSKQRVNYKEREEENPFLDD